MSLWSFKWCTHWKMLYSFEYSHTYSARILEKSDMEFIIISQSAYWKDICCNVKLFSLWFKMIAGALVQFSETPCTFKCANIIYIWLYNTKQDAFQKVNYLVMPEFFSNLIGDHSLIITDYSKFCASVILNFSHYNVLNVM